MKKVLLLLAVVLVGCTAEEQSIKKEVAKDCNCNRVVQVSSIKIVGDAQSGNLSGSTTYYYKTINDCTGLQSDTQQSNYLVKKGQCK